MDETPKTLSPEWLAARGLRLASARVSVDGALINPRVESSDAPAGHYAVYLPLVLREDIAACATLMHEGDSAPCAIEAMRRGLNDIRNERMYSRQIEVSTPTIAPWWRSRMFWCPLLLGAALTILTILLNRLLDQHGKNSQRPSNHGSHQSVLQGRTTLQSKHADVKGVVVEDSLGCVLAKSGRLDGQLLDAHGEQFFEGGKMRMADGFGRHGDGRMGSEAAHDAGSDKRESTGR